MFVIRVSTRILKTEVPSNILEDYFFRHVEFATRKSSGDLLGCCPICREGKSYGKKRRFFFSRKHKFFTCKNDSGCPTMDGVGFLKQVCGLTFPEILELIRDSGEFDHKEVLNFQEGEVKGEEECDISLPPLSRIVTEIKDPDFFERIAISEVEARRLDTAVNRVDLYITKDVPYYDLNSKIHKNRLIIPHKNLDGKLESYQSRALTSKQNELGRYISCLNAPKTLWGLNNIDYGTKELFVLEGAFDAFFVKNSVAGAGMEMNHHQKEQLSELEVWFDLIWCFDNAFEKESENKFYTDLIMSGARVFMWGGDFSKYKDFNEYCVDKGVDEITHEQILEHTYSGQKALKVLDTKTKVVL